VYRLSGLALLLGALAASAAGPDGATQRLEYHESGHANARGRVSDIRAGEGERDGGTNVHIEYEPAPGQGEKVTITDVARGTVTVELRDSYDRVIARTIKGADGAVLSDEKFGYDAEGRLLLHVRKQSGVAGDEVRTGYSYDVAGRLIETTVDNAQVDGSTATVRTKIDHHLGNRTVIEYAPYTSTPGLFTITQTDALGRPERIEQHGGGETLTQRFGYDKAGNTTFVTDNVRSALLRRFDLHNRPLLTLRSDGTRRRSQWDAWGQLVKSEELSAFGASGESPHQIAQIGYLYSTHGRQYGVNESVTGNALRSTRSAFAEDGLTEVTRTGRTSTLIPDIDPMAMRRTSRVTLDAAGRVKTQTVGEGSFHTDTSIFGRTTVTAFSGTMPQTIVHEEPLAGASYVTSTSTDGLGRVTKLHEAAGSYISTTTYDEAGNPTSALPAGHAEPWSQKYDSRGLVVEATAPEGKTVRHHYDAFGNPRRYIDEDSRTTTYEADGLGRIRKTTYEDGTTEEVVYERGTGQIAAIKTRANIWRSFFYDAGGRVIEVRLGQRDLDAAAAPSGDPWLKYTYDTGGRLREVRSKDAAIEYDDYDLLARPGITRAVRFRDASGLSAAPRLLDAHTQQHLWSIFDGERDRYRMPAAGMNVPAAEDPRSPWRNWIVEQRDAGGNIVRQQTADGATITIAAGRGEGRLATRDRFYGAGEHLREGFGYADGDVAGAAPGPVSGLLGRVRAETNLVTAAGSETLRDDARRMRIVSDLAHEDRRSEFQYDDRGRLELSTLRTSDSASFVADSLIHSDVRESRTVTVARQDLAELGSAALRVVPPSWTSTTNDVHQIVSRTLSNEGAARVYDFDFGRRTSDGNWTAEYDEDDRLVVLTRGSTRIRYTYDPRGRIVGRSAENVVGDPLPAETTWVWDPVTDRLVAIYEAGKSLAAGASADEGLVRQYIHGDQGYDDPIEISTRQPGGAVIRYLPLIDYAGAGSVQAVINGTSGKMAERILYADAYGDAPRYLHGAVSEKISVELHKDLEGNLAEVRVRIRLSEAVDPATLPTGIRIAALTADDTVVTTAATIPTLENAHTILLTLGPVTWTTLSTAPSATKLEIAVTSDLRATLWDGPVMPLPEWMLDAPGRASTATHPVIQRENFASLAELAAGVGAGEVRSRTMLEVRSLYLVASSESRTGMAMGFKAAPFVEAATGLVYLRERWYDASTGTFLTPDPMAYEDSSNLYAGFALDPVNNFDPTGKCLALDDIDCSEYAREYANLWWNAEEWGGAATRSLRFFGHELKGATLAVPRLVEGVYDIASHPVETWRGLSNLAEAAWRDPAGMAYLAGNAIINADPDSIAEFVGESLGLAWVGAIAKTPQGAAALSKLRVVPRVRRAQRRLVRAYETWGGEYLDDFRFATSEPRPMSPSMIARSWQGSKHYPGVDRWRDIVLRKGTIVYAGEPGVSGFFTTRRALMRAGNDATTLFEGMQVAPRAGLYRPGLTAFKVLEDTPAAFARTFANPQYGLGGLPQIYIRDFARVLRPVESHLLRNRLVAIAKGRVAGQ
jgi:RHS repeat-associated protein